MWERIFLSRITLGVGKMEIDWGKNSFFRDHSEIFKPYDVKKIPYYCADDDGNVYMEEREGLCRSLASMKDRLEMLGYLLWPEERIHSINS